ncbi:MAG: hypothetical protein WAQ98_06525 [Blastocatellia bacterium]
MTNLLVGDFIISYFLKSFVVGFGIPFLPATRADKALFHYHSPTMSYNLSFSFSLFCGYFVVKFISSFYFIVKSFVIKGFAAYFILAKFSVGCCKFSLADFLAVNSLIISSCAFVPAKSFNNTRYFYLTAISFFTSFWAVWVICLCVIGKYYLLLITHILDGSVPFSRVLFRIFTRIVLVFSSFY